MRVLICPAIGLATVLISFSSLCAQGTERDPNYVPPRIVSTPRLTPPKEVIESGLGGTVRVEVSIDPAGNVISTKEGRGPGTVCQQVTRTDVLAMRNAAREAAVLAKFSPAMRKGKPVESVSVLSFKFPGVEPKTDLVAAPVNVAGDPSASTNGDVARRINGGVLNGKATSLPKPSYPPAARALGAEGAVSVEVLIDENGDVFSAEAVSGHPLLRSASALAACQSKFSPTRLAGNPVKVAGLIVYHFVP